jgi:hypothetical protein
LYRGKGPRYRREKKVDTITKTTIRGAITDLVAWMNEAEKAHKEAHFPMLKPETYYVAGGRKYVKIACRPYESVNGGHVHCFVDAETGDVYKAGSWKAPALNGARYNIMNPESLADLKAKWDPYTSYLYKR